MKKKTKIIIGIIVAFCINIGAGFIYISYEQSKISPLTLSENQINTDSTILNEFMTAVNNNDKSSYSNLSTTEMNSPGTFEKVVSACMNNFGEFKSATYEKAIKSGSYEILLFNGRFANKDNVEITLSLDSTGKVAGIYFK